MTIQLLRFRVALPKLRSCLSTSGFRITPILCRQQSTSRYYMKPTSDKLKSKFRTKDGVPEGFELVYRGGMDWYIQLTNWSAKAMLIIGAYSIWKFLSEETVISFPVRLATDALVGIKSYTEVTILYTTAFIFLLTLRYVCVRYVIRMYYNPKTMTYKAVRVGYLPMGVSYHDFKAGTLTRIPKKYMLPWRNIEYKTKGDSLLIFNQGFRTNIDYDRMFEADTSDFPDEYENENLPKYEP